VTAPPGPTIPALFDRAIRRWALVPDGPPIATPRSHLLPVIARGRSAMLKIATADEERRGAEVLGWWAGDGAARVLEREGDALLVERATGRLSLGAMARDGDDDGATRAICAVAARLHAPRGTPPSSLVPLERWFAELWPIAAQRGHPFAAAAAAARTLLDRPHDMVVLHGDLHHGNVLDFATIGVSTPEWKAIDPKGLVGERGFDFANVFCNPDRAVAIAPGRLERQATVVAGAAALDRDRLLRWVLAYAGLSAAWSIGDDEDPSLALEVARQALAAGGRA
jgi:streptomycin 6-kinase